MFFRLVCTHKCLRERTVRTDFASCNGFVYEGGECKLGYMDPNWVAEQVQSQGPSDNDVIYFDFPL